MNQGFRSDEEILEAINRTQEMMREPEGFDLSKMLEVVREADESYWTERELAYGFVRVILNKAHGADKWRERLKMEWGFKNLEAKIGHIQACAKCQKVTGHAITAIEYINIVPRVVTLEDGEKAIRFLAKKNKMTEVKFREWIRKTSEEIINKIKKDNKTQ